MSVLLEPEVLNSCGTKGGWRDEGGDGDGKVEQEAEISHAGAQL